MVVLLFVFLSVFFGARWRASRVVPFRLFVVFYLFLF